MKKMTFEEFTGRTWDMMSDLQEGNIEKLRSIYDDMCDVEPIQEPYLMIKAVDFVKRICEIVDTTDPDICSEIHEFYDCITTRDDRATTEDEPAEDEDRPIYTKDQNKEMIHTALYVERGKVRSALKAINQYSLTLGIVSMTDRAMMTMAREGFHLMGPYDVVEDIFRKRDGDK